jgi:fused signal recognition particle receptor
VESLAAAVARGAEASRELAEANVLVADAAADAAAAQDRLAAAARDGLATTQAQLSLEAERLALWGDRARLQGDTAEAARLEAEATRLGVREAQAAAEVQEATAAALAAKVRYLREAAEATGGYTAEERAQVAAAEQAAAQAGLEAERLEVLVQRKRLASQESIRLAEAQGRLAEAFREAGVAGVRSVDDVRGAIRSATDSGDLERLAEGLRAAFEAGSLGAEEYRQAIDEVRAAQDELREDVRRVAVDMEALYQQYGADSTRMAKGEFGSAVRSEDVATGVSAYERYVAERGAGAAPQSSASSSATTNIYQSVSLGGVLDVQDRASVEQLARRLAPVMSSLSRRGTSL